MTRRIPADSLLSGLDEHNIGLALSDPISGRLSALVDVADTAGARTNRKELVAALILAATPDADALAGLVTQYRTAYARDTWLVPARAPSVLVFPARKPGPRGRSSRAGARTSEMREL